MSQYDDLALLAGVTFDEGRIYQFGHKATISSLFIPPFMYPCTCDLGVDHAAMVQS